MISVVIKEEDVTEYAREAIKAARRQLSVTLIASIYVLVVTATTTDIVLINNNGTVTLPFVPTPVKVQVWTCFGKVESFVSLFHPLIPYRTFIAAS